MSIFINEEKVGASAATTAINAIKADPELVDMIVNAIVKAAFANAPVLIAAIKQLFAKHDAPKA